jgi:chromate transporter
VSVWAIFWRFAAISVLSYGGGAGIPLVERIAVRETGWIDEREFAVAIGFGQVTPGPAMVVAPFVGYRALGPAGVLAATLGVFLLPWALAAALARQLQSLRGNKWLTGFRRGATAAAVGLFGVTATSLARDSLGGWPHIAIVCVAFALSMKPRIHPFWLLFGGALIGIAIGHHPAAGHGG